MKYALLCATFAATLLCAEEPNEASLLQRIESSILAQDYQIVNVDDIKNLSSGEDCVELGKQISPQLIIKCPAGSTLPLQFAIRGETVSVAATPCELEIGKDLYVIFSEENLFLSSDLQSWKTLSQFWSGTCSFGACVDDGNLITDFEIAFDQ